jgi:hypothetical protein
VIVGNNSRQVLIVYLAINLTLIFSFALPCAGMLNHLIFPGETTFTHGFLFWIATSILCLVLTVPFIPFIRRRIQISASGKVKFGDKDNGTT